MTKPEFKEFKVVDLFQSKRGTRLTVSNRVKGLVPLVTAGYEKTGVAGYIGNKGQELFGKHTVTIDMFGNCFYRNYEYYADDNIISLSSEKIRNELSLLYITTAINKALSGRYSYGKQFRLGELEKLSVLLPVSANGLPDYEYMADYVRQIQADYVRQIQAYLKVTGLDDTTLT